ncbi:MAG TPA: DUF937 domain-containing protein [Longimicrobiales bacterium]|nr:DUF937 domain-containing protein [Longimicrobiales bacterium]
MSQLMDIVSRQLTGDVIGRMGREIGADETSTERAVAAALPLLLGSLARNAQRPEGARSLNAALRDDHDGSLLDDPLGGMLTPTTQSDGAKILGHMFGQREPAVRTGVGRASGLDSGQVLRLMSMLAPIVMAALGRMRRQEDLDAGGLATRLDRERADMVNRDSTLGGLLTGMLDQDGDGSVMDDIGGSLLKGFLRPR